MPLVEVEDLRIRFPSREGTTDALRGVSFAMDREKLGIVGESGSGKSLTGRALLGLVPHPGIVTARALRFDGTDLLSASPRAIRHLRGRRIGLIMQDPKYSLNPVRTIGEQIAEAARLHGGDDRASARRRTLDMLAAVKITDPERVFAAHPHEMSGGMAQRAMIAMMLVAGPDLLIADEPTSALDVAVRDEVLALIEELVRARGMGLILISHDLRLVSRFCDRVAVMYAGRVMETLPAAGLAEARHPYTQGLLACLPSIDRPPGPLPTLSRDPAWLEDVA